MRLHPGKENCHVIDMVASLESGIVTTPTLFGLDPSELVEKADVNDLRSLQDRQAQEEQRQQDLRTAKPQDSSAYVPRHVTFTDYDSVFDLIEDTSGERHIRAISPHVWVEVAGDRYILPTPGGTYLKLEKSDDKQDKRGNYIVSEIRTLLKPGSKAPFMKPREIARSETFADAVHAADTFAAEKYPYHVISKNQAWRKTPATDGQLVFLNRLRPKESPLTADTVTKGKAGDMITKIKHGARGRFAQVEALRRKEGRLKLKIEQEEALREREIVSVGPVLS